jgi:hypothetical protein
MPLLLFFTAVLRSLRVLLLPAGVMHAVLLLLLLLLLLLSAIC